MEVVYSSCRRNFTDAFHVGDRSLYRDAKGRDITEAQFLDACRGQNVLVLVHGYRAEASMPKILAAVLRFFGAKQKAQEKESSYDQVLDGLRKYGIADQYGVIDGDLWPGGVFVVSYDPSVRRADESGAFLATMTRKMRDAGATVDVQTHSLGAHVAMDALLSDPAVRWRNLFLLAPAIADHCVHADTSFGAALAHQVERGHVFYSHRDTVLKYGFVIGETIILHPSKALGYCGAEDPTKLPANVTQHDCTEFIGDHGAYKSSEAFHRLWLSQLIASNSPQFITV